MKKILIIEDEPELARLIELHLRDQGHDVVVAGDGNRGLDLALMSDFDLVILDLMLPDLDGLEICQKIRRQTNYTPILMVTAKSSEFDRVLGLEVGADDYLTKPFSVRELLARVKAILRRIEAVSSARRQKQTITAGELRIDVQKRQVRIADELLHLTAKEFDLLVQFARHPGRVYSRAELLDQVWGYGHDGYEHTVNSHINRLRAKLEKDPANPRYILTVWGVGYQFAEHGVRVD